MLKAMLKPEDWKEVVKVLGKYQIGYTVTYDSHGKNHIEKLVAINPIGVQYYNEDITRIATGVPKAKWIEEKHGYKCSNCNEYANSYEDGYSRDNYFLTHFCPECGAEMENYELLLKMR